ncbi:MAG: hypothetical protein HC899_37995 [Leptolyngbyaceae cyanobacterium SM1_4_3]|nr:hypothetical protein [Leptolyngbyaceae cyanobacterium SM1_4_3]
MVVRHRAIAYFNLENLQGSVYGDVLVASQFGGHDRRFSAGDDIILAGAGGRRVKRQ